MYLYAIKEERSKEKRYYVKQKNGKERVVYTESSVLQSSIIRGVYQWRRDAKADLGAIMERVEELTPSSHTYLYDTTGDRKVYDDEVFRYSINGQHYETIYASVYRGKILETASQERSLRIPMGNGIEHMWLACIDGRYYPINRSAVCCASSNAEFENE